MISNWTPQAVVFDCDGLLVDSEPCWTIAETELFARHGLEFGPQYKARLIGTSLQDGAGVMAEIFGQPENASIIASELLVMVTEVIRSTAEAMPGAAELVELVSCAVPVAVASNSPRALLNATLERGGFDGIFPVSIAGDEVREPKPAPDMYRVACERLGSPPETILAFEDSITGARSAQAAGVRVVGVPTLTHNAPFPADVLVASLLDGDLLTWVRSWRMATT